MLSFLGPYHVTFRPDMCDLIGSIHKTTLPRVGDVNSEMENIQSRWTLTIFQNYVGTRHMCGRDTDVKSCTHAHREHIRAHTIWVQIRRASYMSKVLPSLLCTTSRFYSSSCRCSDHS